MFFLFSLIIEYIIFYMVDKKQKLQTINNNINSSFDEKIDIENDLYAFIDESGDDGFDFTKQGVSKWFNVTAIITLPTTVVSCQVV